MNKQFNDSSIELRNKCVSPNDKHSNKYQILIVIGALCSSIDFDCIKRKYGFKRVEVYDYRARSFDLRTLKNNIDKKLVIVACADHYLRFLSACTSLKRTIESDPHSFPPTKFIVGCRNNPAKLSSNKLEKALDEFRCCMYIW